LLVTLLSIVLVIALPMIRHFNVIHDDQKKFLSTQKKLQKYNSN